MLGSRVRVKPGAGLPMINRKSARVVLLAVNRWYTAVGYWQWHQQNGTNRYATVLNRVLPVPTQVASGHV